MRCLVFLFPVFLLLSGRPASAQQTPVPTRPALIGRSPGAIINRIDIPKLVAAGQKDGEVMFCAVVDGEGKVTAPFTYNATPDSKLLEQELQRVLADGRMIPAVRNGEPISVFYFGTASFRLVEKKPRLRIFANQEAKELKSENDFIAPQPCLGGDSKFTGVHYPAEAMAVPVSGQVDLALKIDAAGNLLEEKIVNESPPLLGLGDAAMQDFRDAKFIPAFRNGQAVASDITLPVVYQP